MLASAATFSATAAPGQCVPHSGTSPAMRCAAPAQSLSLAKPAGSSRLAAIRRDAQPAAAHPVVIAELSSERETAQESSSLAGPFADVATKLVATCLGAALSLGVVVAPPAIAVTTPATPPSFVRLPPLSQDPARCERAFVGNTIGQANGVADKLLDLRKCNFANNKTDLKGKTLSAALMADAIFDGADMTEVIMSKAYASNGSFKGTDFTNGVLDRVVFDGADLTNAKFNNTVLSGTTFDGADLNGTDFEDALIGYVDIQKLCRNTTLSGDAKAQLGCR